MLGKLFNLTSSAGASNPPPPSQLPSSPSPEHTSPALPPRPGLSPASRTLPAAELPGNFDYDGLIDLDVRDVRVVVMQDSLGSVNPALLFDSHPGPTVRCRIAGTRPRPGKPASAIRGPWSSNPRAPQPRQGAFDRRPSVQSRHYHHVESDTQRASREYREELANFTSCIFANSEVMSYKGTSTKVHIVPTEFRSDISSSYVGDGKGSMGRASMRSSKLAQSFTSESASAAFEAPTHSLRPLERKKVLITRLFPVNLPNDEMETPASASGPTPLSRHSEDGGFPLSHIAG
ncbi:hypothetical protein PG990_010678 [Apiospora arundinis]